MARHRRNDDEGEFVLNVFNASSVTGRFTAPSELDVVLHTQYAVFAHIFSRAEPFRRRRGQRHLPVQSSVLQTCREEREARERLASSFLNSRMAPSVVNPYLRKLVNKPGSTSSQPPGNQSSNSAESVKPKPSLPSKRKQQAPADDVQYRPVTASSHHVTKKPLSHTKKPKSFKSQLKQQIENLKRAKEQEKQCKILEQKEKQREAERQERLREQQKAAEKQRKEAQERERVEREAQEQAMQQWQEQQKRKQQWMLHGMGHGMYVPSPAYGPSILPFNCYATTTYHVPMPAKFVTPAKATLDNNGDARNTLQLSNNTPSSATQVTPTLNLSNGQSLMPSKQTPPAAASSKLTDASTSDPSTLAATLHLMTKTTTHPTGQTQDKVILEVKPNKGESSMMKEEVSSDVPTPNERSTDTNTAEKFPSDRSVTSEPTVSVHCLEPYAKAPSSSAGYNLILGQPCFAPMYAALPVPFPLYGLNPYQPNPIQCLPPKPVAAPPKPKPSVLHRSPLSPLSPYAESHQLLGGEIVIFKAPGESFGVTLRYETRSTLVDPNVLEGNSPCKSFHPVDNKDHSVTTAAGTVDVATGTDGSNEVATNARGPTESLEAERSSIDTLAEVQSTVTDVSQAVGTQATQANSTFQASMSAEANVSSSVEVVPAKQRRRRRRRVFFGVMTVVAAEQQNARIKTDDPSHMLKPGDIILKLNGHDVGGLTFQQACGLFASCDTPASSSKGSESHADTIRCSLTVARLKRKPIINWKPALPTNINSSVGTLVKTSQPLNIPLPKIPLVVNDVTNQVISGDFSNMEMLALAQGAIRCVFEPTRTLGYEIPLELEVKCFQLSALARRDYPAIRSMRDHAARSIELSMKQAAISHWISQWRIEAENMGITDDLQVSYLSDAQRSALRELPRPAKGCRCGSMNHAHVNDSKCVLYRNLRYLSASQVEPEERKKESKLVMMSNLNAVETAFKDRIFKLKEETEREEEEARFVNEMEELQVVRSKVAVFAPTFTAMVLSSIAELSGEISAIEDIVCDTEADTVGERSKRTGPTTGSQAEGAHVDEDDDVDDDLPLMALGRRSGPSSEEPEAKRIKTQDSDKSSDERETVEEMLPLDLSFLAKVLRHISHTWGHLYKEPSDADYAW